MNAYDAALKAARDSALGAKPQPPPQGASAEALAVYNNELDNWHFEKQALDVQNLTEADTEAEKARAAAREGALAASGSFSQSRRFTTSLLLKHGSDSILAPLFTWLDAEAAALDPEFFHSFLVCVRRDAGTGSFGVRIQAASPTSSFVVVADASPAVVYANPLTHDLAGSAAHRDRVPEGLTTAAAMAPPPPSTNAFDMMRLGGGGRLGGHKRPHPASAAAAAPPPVSPIITLLPGDRVTAVNGVSLAGLGISFVDVAGTDGRHQSLCFSAFLAAVRRSGPTLLLTVRRSRSAVAAPAASSASSFSASSASSAAASARVAPPSLSPAAYFSGSAAAAAPARSPSGASGGGSGPPQLELSLPVRPRWSYAVSEARVRPALLALLRIERTALRAYGDHARQHVLNRLIPELGRELHKFAAVASSDALVRVRADVERLVAGGGASPGTAVADFAPASSAALLHAMNSLCQRLSDGILLESTGRHGVPGEGTNTWPMAHVNLT